MSTATDLVRSLTRLGWSLSMLGAEQAGRALGALGNEALGNEADTGTASALDRVSEAAVAGMSSPARELFLGVDRLQATAIDLVFGAGDPVADVGRGLARAALVSGGARGTRRMLEALAPTLDGDLRLGAIELANEIESFELFADPKRLLGFDGDCCSDRLWYCLGRARREPQWRAAWLIEGLGYLRAEAAWQRSGPGASILDEARLPPPTDPTAADAMPMHTGLGLSLGRRYLPRLRSPRHRTEALAELVCLIRRNARPGLELVAFEAVGFVLRLMAPSLLALLDRDLTESAPSDSEAADLEAADLEAADLEAAVPGHLDPGSLRAALWHGAGRAIYFAPSHFAPGRWRRAFGETRELATDGTAQANLLAGHAWAVTLVNLRHPEILAAFLHEATEALADSHTDALAVVAGVSGALIAWAALFPAEPLPGEAAGPDLLERLSIPSPLGQGEELGVGSREHLWQSWIGDRVAAARRGARELATGAQAWNGLFRIDPGADLAVVGTADLFGDS